MIRAEVDWRGGRLLIRGHAGSGNPDVVCMMVSALTGALEAYLERSGTPHQSEGRPGFLALSAEGCEEAFALVFCGLEEIAAQYPEFLQVVPCVRRQGDGEAVDCREKPGSLRRPGAEESR